MKVNVNLFKPSGKWAYGGVVDVDTRIPMFNDNHLRNLVSAQDFVAPGAFEDHLVVVTHRDDYDQDPSPYFCQAAYAIGRFTDILKTKKLKI